LKGRYHLPTTAEVGRCYIDAGLRRQGIGSRLVTAMTEFCREHGYRTMYLHTHRFLPGGFNFWEKQGFVITIDQGGSLDIVHMEKLL
jgi:GNAT superfamily N-acetyltransferase